MKFFVYKLLYFECMLCNTWYNETSIYVNVCEEAIDFERTCKIIIQTPFYSFMVAQNDMVANRPTDLCITHTEFHLIYWVPTRVFKQKTWSDGLKTKKKPQKLI